MSTEYSIICAHIIGIGYWEHCGAINAHDLEFGIHNDGMVYMMTGNLQCFSYLQTVEKSFFEEKCHFSYL